MGKIIDKYGLNDPYKKSKSTTTNDAPLRKMTVSEKYGLNIPNPVPYKPTMTMPTTVKEGDETKAAKKTVAQSILSNKGSQTTGGTFLGGWKQPEAKEKKTSTAAEIAARQKEAAEAAKRISYLEGLDLKEQQKKIDALSAESKKGSKLNIHAFGAYDVNNRTDVEKELAKAQEDYNYAESLQYRKKGDAALSALDAETQQLIDIIARYNIDARSLRGNEVGENEERERTLKALMSKGMTAEEIEQLVDYRMRQINEQEYDEKVSNIEALASRDDLLGISDMGAIAASVLSVPLNLGSGAGYLDLLMQSAHNKQMGYDRPLDYKTGAMSLYGQASAAREIVSQNIIENAETETGGQVASFLYQTGMSMADSAVVAGLGVLGLGTAGTLLLGGSAATAAAVDAKNRGGSDSQALMSGALAGAAETVFERISIDSLLTGKYTKDFVGSEFKKLWLDVGVQGAVEGSEELFTAFANHITDRAIMGGSSNYAKSIREYMEAGMTEDEAKARALADFAAECATSFVGGVISGSVMGGFANAARPTVGSYTTKTTENDQKVIDKLVENSIAEAEKDGKTLTDKEKAKLRDDVMETVERGEVSFDTIAEVLDKEGYNAYKNLAAEEQKAIEELAELYEGEELQQEVAKFLEGAESKPVRSELDKKVFGMVKDGKLAESYLERGRRSQAYEADVSRYDEKQRATIQNAINSGVLNNTKRTHEFVDLIAKISADKGIAFDFTNNEKLKSSMFAVDGATVNGYYDKAIGTIGINIDSSKALNFVVGHEITHVLENTALYGNLRDILFEYAKSKKASNSKFENEYAERLHNARELYKNVEGYEGVTGLEKIKKEVVADLVGDYLFTDADFVNNLVKNKNLFQKLWNEIKYLHSVSKAGSKEEKQLLEVKRAFEKAYQDNGKAKDNRIATDEGNVWSDIVGTKKAETVTRSGEVKHSLSRNAELMQNAEDYNNSHLSVDLESAKQQRQEIYDFMIRNADRLKLPEDIEGNTAIKNSSYDITEENTTVCIRSMAADALCDAVAEELGRPLTVQDTLRISQDLMNYTDEPECVYCYVATDRRAYREFLGSYYKQMQSAIEAIQSGKNSEEVYRAFLDGRKDTKNMRNRFAMWERIANGGKMISAKDLASEKMMQEAMKDPALAPQVNDARDYAQKASWAKKRMGYQAYNGHILEWKQRRINDLNKHYGLRFYSFSDFSPAFVLENMQQITDASVRGLKGLAYTKVLDFAEIFAPSDININISVFGYSQNGSVAQDGMMGADWKGAQDLRNKYENVGITFVATNDAQIDWALDQDWIDVVIPYHLVRTGQAVAKHFGYTNYTAESGDTKGANWKKGDKKTIYPSEHNNDKHTYLAALAEANLEPRFARWVNHPNYMKLVNETRRAANDTPHMKAEFNVDAAKASLERMMKQGGYFVPIGGDYANMQEIATEIADDIRRGTQYSLSDSNYTVAVERGDMGTAQKMVDEAAKAAGYDSPKLYHGTKSFGFTNIKTEGVEDGVMWSPFFATDKIMTAQTYSRSDKVRTVSEGYNLDYDAIVEDESKNWNDAVYDLAEHVSQLVGVRGWLDSYTVEKEIGYLFEDLLSGNVSRTGANNRIWDWVTQELEEDILDAMIPYWDGEQDALQEAIEVATEEDIVRLTSVINAIANIETDSRGNYQLYANTDNLLVVDAEENNWNNIPFEADGYSNPYTGKPKRKWNTRELSQYAKDNGYSGVRVKNVIDDGGQGVTKQYVPSDVYIFFNPQEQVKSADPVTYDDNGNVIPLSERFNPQNEDIRYSLSEQNAEYPVYGDYNVYGEEVAIAPVAENATVEDIAPVAEKAEPVDVSESPVLNRLNKKLSNSNEELENNKRLRDESNKSFDEKIAKAQAELDAKANKDTQEANAIKRRIERLQRLKADRDAEYAKRIGDISARVSRTEENIAKYHPGMDRAEKAVERIDKMLEYDKAELSKEYNETKALLADKNAYISSKASELYDEIRNLKKGVRASALLGELLDSGYEWSSIRSALNNVKYTPDQTVNVNSAAESRAREILNEDYENSVYNLDEDYAARVKQLEDEAAKKRKSAEGKPIARKTLHQGIVENIKASFKEKGFDFDEVLKKAKNLSTFSTVDNTPQRVMEKALGYKEGQILSDITVNKVAQNETEGIKWLNSFTDRKNGLLAQISKQYNIKPGSKESAAAQMYAEGFYVGENNDIIAYGDAELAKDFPDANTQANIKGLAKDPRIRKIYDDTLAAINQSRTRNAYPEIPRLDNYFLHFRAMEDTFSRLGLPFNPNDIKAKDLPTDLNGVTADLKPGQPYFASAMHRTGKRTSFDLLGGLERYLSSAKNQIYHIDDIQTLRAVRNYIADTYGQAKGLENLDTLSEEEAQQRIEDVYGAHLSTFAKFLNEEANILAGKTALIDRGLEGIIGRRGITFLNELNRQVGSNMVGYNVSSSLTNFLPVVQTFAKGNKAAFVKAFAQTVSNKVSKRSDGFAENSPVMIRRQGADRFYRNTWQKISDPGYALLGAVDNISTELIARTKYNELVSKGMDSQKAHYETDKWVSRLMGDRSLGQMPQIYNSKMLGLITKFQLEVRNQLDAQFYDTIQEAKVSNEYIQNEQERNAKTAAKVASTFVQLAVAQHLFGKAFEAVAGYNPAFDIIGVLLTAFGFDDDEDSEDTFGDNIEQGFLALLEDLPYTSTFTGGRIPIASALPIEELVTGQDEWGNDKSRLETLGEVAPYYLLPGGYGQIKKTAQGLNMFSDDHPIAGSYTDSGNLRFPVEDTVGNRIKAGIFGQYASKNAREYFDSGLSPLKEKQIQELIEVDLPISEYWAYRKGLAQQKTVDEKLDYIDSLDLPIYKKNILANNAVTRKNPIDMADYE